MSEGRTIGRLAAEAGVNVETIRFYERRGLIQQPESPTSGWRRYGEEVLRRIRFIKRAQQLGFSLDDVAEMLALRGSRSEAQCGRTRSRAQAKIAEVEARVSDLCAMRKALEALVRSCGSLSPHACPLIEALDPTPESSTVVQ